MGQNYVNIFYYNNLFSIINLSHFRLNDKVAIFYKYFPI